MTSNALRLSSLLAPHAPELDTYAGFTHSSTRLTTVSLACASGKKCLLAISLCREELAHCEEGCRLTSEQPKGFPIIKPLLFIFSTLYSWKSVLDGNVRIASSTPYYYTRIMLSCYSRSYLHEATQHALRNSCIVISRHLINRVLKNSTAVIASDRLPSCSSGEGGGAISLFASESPDCFVASLLAMTNPDFFSTLLMEKVVSLCPQ